MVLLCVHDIFCTSVFGGFVLSRVATIGYHVIYKIVDTCMLKIYDQPVRGQNSTESKLVDNTTCKLTVHVCLL